MCFDTLFGQADVAVLYGSGGIVWDWQCCTGLAGGKKMKKSNKNPYKTKKKNTISLNNVF